ncbi:Osmotin thaumatin-like protein [Dacryopinax primogenitus]|uniref:Osmotin thaumatin-like protein n=1 Tax=Dacryopinax primogenitus (strain DJM 731) TaxID=1858805 RepID=M5G729_DACPD|nr:Osmotin thaumatin-like protein [Dacryopinax primogenitus]EJU04529.1 Osmotin thaumatin-like protein [Dacryopinax primogenitus]
MHLSLLALVFVRVVTAVRTFTVYNGCPFTVWPAIYTNLAAGTAVPQYQTGWQADAYTTVNFSVPDAWTSGRIWGRRDCTFPAGNTSASTCLDGGCTGGLLCDVNTGTGMPPATLAEFSLGGTTGTDFYDVSLVDGYNLPIRITPTSGCAVAECPWDLGPLCPTTLAGPFDSTGYPVGCKSACIAGVDGNPSKSPNCCSGSFNTPQTCPSSGVAFYWFFKGYCPNAYAYPFDESSGTALWTCPSNNLADYTITFCPAPDGAEPSVSPPSTSTSFAFESTTSWMSTPSSMNIMSTTTGTTQPAPGSDTLPNSSVCI